MKKSPVDVYEEHLQARQKFAERAVAEVASSDAGRLFLRELIYRECKVEHVTFTGNSNSYFVEGKRAVGLKLVEMLKTSQPTLYLKLVQEEVTESNLEARLKDAADAAKESEE